MIPKILLLAVTTTLLVVGVAKAGETINETGALAQVVDKWNETEPDKGHKLVEYAGRGVGIPDDPAAPKVTWDCVGNYEYMPDGSWKGTGTCTDHYPGGDKVYLTCQGASGGGTYTYENLTDTLVHRGPYGQLSL